MVRSNDPFSTSAAGLVGLLVRLTTEYDFLHLYRDRDSETYHAMAFVTDSNGVAKRVSCMRESLLATIQALATGGDPHAEPKRACKRCGGEKAWSAFGRDKHGPGGRRIYCLECERLRVKEYDAQQEERRNGAVQGVIEEMSTEQDDGLDVPCPDGERED